MENKMYTKTVKIEDSVLCIPGLEKFKGKIVEIIIKETGSQKKRKKELKKFLSLRGKVSLDSGEVEKLRDASHI